MDAKQALEVLKEGNKRYVEGKLQHPHTDNAHRDSLKDGQKPLAVILSCADSRVVPEYLFDQGLGDLFVIRVAGNVAEDKALGSIEYAVKFLGTRLIVVLGHEKCGAVSASLGDDEVPGHIGSIVEDIKPAVHIANGMEGDILTNAVKLNAKIVSGKVKGSHPIITDLVKNEGLVIKPAYYKLEDGAVEWL